MRYNNGLIGDVPEVKEGHQPFVGNILESPEKFTFDSSHGNLGRGTSKQSADQSHQRTYPFSIIQIVFDVLVSQSHVSFHRGILLLHSLSERRRMRRQLKVRGKHQINNRVYDNRWRGSGRYNRWNSRFRAYTATSGRSQNRLSRSRQRIHWG